MNTRGNLWFCALGLAVAMTFSGYAEAGVMGGWNWADNVTDYSSNIKNHAGTLMDGLTTWWLTGSPDDYQAGWSAVAPDEYIVLSWDTPLPDMPGDDLRIRLFGGPGAGARVLASDDGVTFSEIGSLGKGEAMVFREESFDFAGQFAGAVSHVRFERTVDGPKTGMFFDAIAGRAVPEPGVAALLLCGATVFLFGRRRLIRTR